MRILKVIALLLTVTLTSSCATSAFNQRIQLPKPYVDNGILVEVNGTYSSDAGFTIQGISGIATNLTDNTLNMCAIYLEVIGPSGARVSEAVAVTNHLNARERWQFQATFTTPFSVPIKEIRPEQVQVITGLP